MKKIIAIIGLMIMLMSTFALAIVDAEELQPINKEINEEDVVIFRGSLDKTNVREPRWYDGIIDLLEGQPLTFDNYNEGDLGFCSKTATSKVYQVYRGGVNSQGTPIRAGKLCENGDFIDYIYFSEVANTKRPLFADLWYKSNTDDKLIYANEDWSARGVFNDERRDVLNMYYVCYSCEVPEVRGCTDSSALNYNSDATRNDGSCEFLEEETTSSTTSTQTPPTSTTQDTTSTTGSQTTTTTSTQNIPEVTLMQRLTDLGDLGYYFYGAILVVILAIWAVFTFGVLGGKKR